MTLAVFSCDCAFLWVQTNYTTDLSTNCGICKIDIYKEPSPSNFLFLQMMMSKRTTWLRSSRPRQPLDPSISRVHDGNDPQEEERPPIRRRIRRSMVPRLVPPMTPPIIPAVVEAFVEPLRHEAQRHRSLPRVDHSLSNPLGCDMRHPSLPIYPPMPTQVLDCLRSLVENPTLPWFSDLIHEQSYVPHQILWRGWIADDGLVYLFELTFEDNNSMAYRSLMLMHSILHMVA